MKCECAEFEHVMETVHYIRIFQDIFDIQNLTGKEGAMGYKRPITADTAEEFFQRFREAMFYIKKLKIKCEKGPIISLVSATPFVGFYNNMLNFMKLYKELVQTNRIDSLVTHRFSQDHLESFISSIRSMGGTYHTLCDFKPQ